MARPTKGESLRGDNDDDDKDTVIWSANDVLKATTNEVIKYIIDKINDYKKKELKDNKLYKYQKVDFEHFTLVVYKKTIAKTKLLRDYLFDNRVYIPKNRQSIIDNLVKSRKEQNLQPLKTLT